MSQEKQKMTHHKRKSRETADKTEAKRPRLGDVWAVHSAGGWPQDLSLDRAEIYEGRT